MKGDNMRYLASIILSCAPLAFNSEVRTVTIKTDNGPVRINHSDYDPKEHKLHEDSEPATPLPPNAGLMQQPPSEGEPKSVAMKPPTVAEGANERIANGKFGVMQDGGKFYVVDINANNARVTDIKGINKNGYAENKPAWDALFALGYVASAS